MAEQESAEARLAMIKAGFKGGPFWGPIAEVGALDIIPGYPEISQEFQQQAVIAGGKTSENGPGWNQKRPK